MSDRSANIDLTPYFDESTKSINVSLEDLENALKETHWMWHTIDDEELSQSQKITYDKMRSIYTALMVKYAKDLSMISQIKELYNKYAPIGFDNL